MSKRRRKERREQSPHYIPELDPDNPKCGKDPFRRFLWAVVFLGFALIAGGAALYAMGDQRAGIVLAAIGLVILAPIWVFISG